LGWESSLQLLGGAVMAAAALFCLLSGSGPRAVLAGSLLAASGSTTLLLCFSRLSSGTRAADALAFFIIICSVCGALVCWAAALPSARGTGTGPGPGDAKEGSEAP
jgi:hypothetical protein